MPRPPTAAESGRLLIVEDDQAVADAVGRGLHMAGYSTCHHSDGGSALQAISAEEFLSESVLVLAVGGLAGAALGAGATVLYVVNGNLTLAVPPFALAGGVLAMAVGALAGIYPSLRAARLSPTSALRSA